MNLMRRNMVICSRTGWCLDNVGSCLKVMFQQRKFVDVDKIKVDKAEETFMDATDKRYLVTEAWNFGNILIGLLLYMLVVAGLWPRWSRRSRGGLCLVCDGDCVGAGVSECYVTNLWLWLLSITFTRYATTLWSTSTTPRIRFKLNNGTELIRKLD